MHGKSECVLPFIPSYIVDLRLLTIEMIESGNDGFIAAHLDCEFDIRKAVAALPLRD